ncbi:MAG TPA: MFS transporter [Caulobacterales bacterium]|nr:MFS transporter [Caulobacterales bacterium]
MRDTVSDAGSFQGHGSKPYRAYVLGALVVIYMFNFIDRVLLGIVQESIKHEFNLTNLQLGIIGGPAFALLFTIAGLPIARWAERGNRISIVAMGAALWSLFTTLCGFTQNFFQLLAARIGVGIGEAACVPPSQSVISDYFPANRRASALAIYALGIPIGSGIAAFGGGWLTQHFDWRSAFWLLGAPGLVTALLLKLTVREPPRTGAAEQAPSFGETLKILFRKPSFWHTAFAGALVAACGYGSLQFLVSHLVRNYNLGATLPEKIANASYVFGIYAGVSMGVGTFLGGFLADRFSKRHKNALAWLPALGLVLAVPLYAVSYLETALVPALALLLVAPLVHYLYTGPYFAIAQSVSPPRARATATAILVFVGTIIGNGIGPPLVGFANDFFASQILAHEGLNRATACADATNAAACAAADGMGVRYALVAMLVFLLWAALHFLLAGRTLQRDRES